MVLQSIQATDILAHKPYQEQNHTSHKKRGHNDRCVPHRNIIQEFPENEQDARKKTQRRYGQADYCNKSQGKGREIEEKVVGQPEQLWQTVTGTTVLPVYVFYYSAGDRSSVPVEQTVNKDETLVMLPNLLDDPRSNKSERSDVPACGKHHSENLLDGGTACVAPPVMLLSSVHTVNDVGVCLRLTLKKFGDFFGRYLKIVVDGDYEPAAAIRETAQQRVVLAEVPGQANGRYQVRKAGLQFADDVPAAVRAVVFDHDQFERPAPFAEHRYGAHHERLQGLLGVVHRNEHGVFNGCVQSLAKLF
jgi:hypothetical protein